MQHNTHKKPFVHLAYHKIMIGGLPLRDLSHRVKAAAVVLGAPVRVFYSSMARDRQDTLLGLTHGGWHELNVEQPHHRQRYFPLLDTEENRVIRPEQDLWEHLVLYQQASEETEKQA